MNIFLNYRIKSLLMASLFFWTFIFVYYFRIVPAFSYMGYRWNDPYPGFLWVASFFGLFPSFFMGFKLVRPSQIANWILYIFVYMPSVSIGILVVERPWYHGLALQVVLMCAVFLQLFVSWADLIPFRKSKITWNQYSKFLGVLVSLLFVLVFGGIGIRLNFMAFIDEYFVRDAFNAKINAWPLLAYLISWLSDVINPLWLLVSLRQGEFRLASISCAGQILLFLQSGHKTVLLSIIMIIVLFLFAKRFKGRLVQYLLLSATLLLIFSYGIDVLTDSYFASSMFARRAIHTPGMLTGFYWDFFSNNSFLFYSHSFMGWLFDYQYAVTPPFVIGYYYFNSVEMAANANYLADGFSNLGYSGIIIHAAIISALLHVYDSLTRNIVVDFAALLLIVPVLGLVNSALFTCILTGGLSVLIFLVAIMPFDDANLGSIELFG